MGVALIVAGAGLLVLVGFVLRPRVARPAGMVLAAAAGAALGAGALLVQDHATAADWAVVMGATVLLTPAHVRLVFGPFGRRQGDPETRADPRTGPVPSG